MKTILTSLSYAVMGAVLLIGSSAAQAAVISYNFWGEVQDGPLATLPQPTTYAGSFTFDDTGTGGIGEKLVTVDTLDFNFLGNAFTKLDGDTLPQVVFSDGVFLGLSYTVSSFDPAFSIIPGLTDSADSYFAYDGTVGTGYGSVNYAPVPVPGAVWLLLSALPAVGAFVRRRHPFFC